MTDQNDVKLEQEPTKPLSGSMPRIREVTAEVRTLIQDLRLRKIPEAEIILGVIVAIQSVPVTKAIDASPEIKEFLEKTGRLLKSGKDLIDLLRK